MKNNNQKDDLLTIYSYLTKSGFSEQQAKGLARVINKVKDNAEQQEVKPNTELKKASSSHKLFSKVCSIGFLVAIAFIVGNSIAPISYYF
jgi:hypothetical protein